MRLVTLLSLCCIQGVMLGGLPKRACLLVVKSDGTFALTWKGKLTSHASPELTEHRVFLCRHPVDWYF